MPAKKNSISQSQNGELKSTRKASPRLLKQQAKGDTREDHTQKKFVAQATADSLAEKPGHADKSKSKTNRNGRLAQRSPSTAQLNKSNVRRKPAARGRQK